MVGIVRWFVIAAYGPHTTFTENGAFTIHCIHSVAVLGGFLWFLRTTPFSELKFFLLLSSS